MEGIRVDRGRQEYSQANCSLIDYDLTVVTIVAQARHRASDLA
jgi:hypothetical protein